MRFLILSLLLCTQCVSRPANESKTSQKACPSRLRAVIDMGSGATKLNLGEVAFCPDRPTELVRMIPVEASVAVPLEASKNAAGEIPKDAQEAAVQALKNLRDSAMQAARQNQFKEIELAVVGTHALRSASNRGEVVRFIEAAGFNIRPLTQDEEAEAGFEAVMRQELPADCEASKILVWDVGGGSTQLTRAQTGNPNVVKFNLGAESFRKAIVARMKNRTGAPNCPLDESSPNPLGRKRFAQSRALVREMAMISPRELRADQACVIGIGGVHTKAVVTQIEKNWSEIAGCACGTQMHCEPLKDGYRKKDLECLGDWMASKTDCAPEIKGPYASTAVTNLAMVLGFMDQMKIEEVRTRPINMGNYFVLDNKRLNFQKLVLP